VELVSAAARMLGGMGRPALLGLRLALWIWELAPLLAGRGRSFSRLSQPERLSFTEGSVHSRAPWRRLPLAVLTPLCASAFVSHPRVAAALKAEPGCLDPSPPSNGPRLHPIAYPEIRGEVSASADVVVVGSGAGGAVVAKELAELGLEVIVVEEGGYFTRDDFQGPTLERVRRMYRDGGLTVAAGLPPIPVPMGKAVGGTTVVNSGTCFRAPDSVLRRWASSHGLDSLAPDVLAPVYERVEETLHVMPTPEALLGENARVFRRGAERLGLNGRPICRNIDGCRGCGVCAMGCPSDAKRAMHLSYLPRAEAAGARIYSGCRVRKLRVEGGRAAGIEAEILAADEGSAAGAVRGRLVVRAGAVVLAAGAVHTPLLLMENGLAPRGGPVGRGLRIHPAIAVTAAFEEEVLGWRGTLQPFFVDDYRESHGLMFEVTSPTPTLAARSLRDVGHDAIARIAEYPHLASVGLFVAESSCGRVRRLPGGRPLLSYRLNARDVQRLVFGIGVAARVFFAAGARRVYPGLAGVPSLDDPSALEGLEQRRVGPRALSAVGFHPMSTVRMGRDPTLCGVDPHGESRALPYLWVADASVLPDCPGVNPQLTIMAAATQIARGIATRL
jgi:choline dehydrogenase-like flavoprotein